MAGPTSYQRVTSASDYDTAGQLFYDKFDGVDDGYGTATFAAGTLTSDMDCFMLLRYESPETAIIAFNGPRMFAYTNTYESASPHVDAGSPTYFINGAAVAAARNTLHATLPKNIFSVLEVRNLDLSTWTAINFGNAGGVYQLNGAIAEIILAPAQSPASRTQIREYLAAKGGISL